MSVEEAAERLAALPDVDVELDAPAGAWCTYRVGGPIAVLATVSSQEALAEVAAVLAECGVDPLTIGKGSNLLIADAGYPGVAIHLSGSCAEIEIDGTKVVAGGASSLPVVARATVAAGLTGFEWAVGVPGTIGGAVRMNAGGHGSDMSASLVSIAVADTHLGGTIVMPAGALDLSYRHSAIEPWQIVASATLQLEESAIDGAELLSEIVGWRREHQPGGANAGSVFTNPEGDSAGRLIDAAGLKGRRRGTAEVSEKHANFIQAEPDGSADDIISLMAEIVAKVEDEFEIRLSAETRLVGFTDELVAAVQHHEVPIGEHDAGGAPAQ